MIVVFVAPYLLRTTLQFVNGAARVPGVRLVLVSEDPLEKVPAELKGRLTAFRQVKDSINVDVLTKTLSKIRQEAGRLDRVLGILEKYQIPLAEVRERLGIDGVRPDVARNFREKARMKDVLGSKGLPCARHCLAQSLEQALAFGEQTGYPLVVKPPAGEGGRDTFQVTDADHLRRSLADRPPSPRLPVLFEEFLRGQEYTFESVRIKGRMVWRSITSYEPSPLNVLENAWIQWCILLPRELQGPRVDHITQAVDQSLTALGLETGFSHLEWFALKDDRLAISEVGARPPGGQLTSMTAFAHDFDFHKAWAELMIFDRFTPPERRFAAGALFMRAQSKGRVMSVHGLDVVHQKYGSMIVEAKLPEAGQPTSTTYEGEGYVIIRHPDTQVVRDALHFMRSHIRVIAGS